MGELITGPAGLELSRHSSAIGWWEMASRPPAARLRPHVRGYCGYEEETVGFTSRRELPSGEVVVILGFGPGVETTYPAGPELPTRHRSFVAGLHETHCIVRTAGTQAGIQVNLTPLGAHLLLGARMSELANRVVGIEALLGDEGPLLIEELHDAGGWEDRFRILDAALERRLDSARPASPDVAWAWSRLTESAGRIAIGELCSELGCSRRHLLRRFDEQVGVGPKALARILRFQRAVHMLGHRDGPSWIDERERGAAGTMSWAEVAFECGYFDQAHMNRDFRQFAGASPGELLASLLPDGGGLAG